jgi:HPt (histidine-containing phosphotransfer) domain-containing protein
MVPAVVYDHPLMQEPAGTPPLDIAAAMRVVGGDKALLVELAQMFLEELPVRLVELRAAVRGRDPERTRLAAHNLKGALATLGATPARDLAHDLEQLGRTGGLAAASGILARLEGELARVSDFLAAPGWVDG